MVDSDLAFPDSGVQGIIYGNRVGSNNNIPSSVIINLSNVTSASFPDNNPSTPQQMQVVSTSASDTASGSGIQQVLIEYLTSPSSSSGFVKKTETVTLNGTTPVLTVARDIFRIDMYRATRIGSSKAAVGDVKLQSVGGALTFEQIDALTKFFRSAQHFIPYKYRTEVTDISKGVTTLGGVIFIVRATGEDPAVDIPPVVSDQLEFSNGAFHSTMLTPIRITNIHNIEMSVVIAVKGRSSNQSASAGFRFRDIPA